MEKLSMETKDWTAENVEKIGAMFPQAITEARDADGKLRKAINFDVLRQLLSSDVLAGDEAYEFTWVGKKAAMVEAGRPIRKTLRPCKEESKDWDNTENLYIEGDNLDVLKLLQESYLGKVKMIYIDPPYNTGKDFIYNDRFEMDKDDYQEQTGLFDEDENKNFKPNLDSNPRFHSDWCSMMYPRLQLARNLLSDDGVMFISIDDGESPSLVKICDEVFGESNRIALICQKSRASVSNDKIISPNHNTLLFYAKNQKNIFYNRKNYGLDPILEGFNHNANDGRGDYRLVPVDGPGGAKKGNPFFEFLGVEGYFRFSKETMQRKFEDGLVVKKGNSLYQKYYKSTAAKTRRTTTTWWEDTGLTSSATSSLRELMGGAYFDNPKPLELLNRMLKITTNDKTNAIILDFFSGSATTAHAVMQLNPEDGGKRKFIMVQLPEVTDEKSEAYKAGYKNICEIGKERIRRAGEKIKSEIETESLQPGLTDTPKQVPDIGFRVLKLDDSNMKDVYYNPRAYDQEMISGLESNIKEDRSDLDLLFGCLLDWGLPLSMPYTSETIEGVTVHTYNEGDLVACFDENIPESVIKTIANRQPLRAVFRDGSFSSSPEKINVAEIFKLLAPNTHVKVL